MAHTFDIPMWRRSRVHGRVAIVVLVVIVLAAAGAWWLLRQPEPTAETPAEPAAASPAPDPDATGEPSAEDTALRNVIDALSDATPSADAASRSIRSYPAEIASLRSDYNKLKSKATADALAALEKRWWQLTLHVYSRSSMGVDYGPSDEARVLAISRAWRNHLSLYASSLRTGDQSLMPLAEGQLELAERLASGHY